MTCHLFFTVLECGLPADIPNAKLLFVNGTRAFQSVIAYNCNPGYQAVGRTTLMCDVDERWNGPPPRYVYVHYVQIHCIRGYENSDLFFFNYWYRCLKSVIFP